MHQNHKAPFALFPRISLAALAVFTSTNFLVMKSAVGDLQPASLMVWRFFFSLFIFVPLSKGKQQTFSKQAFIDGGLVGVLLGIAMMLLTMALAEAPTGETAFFVSSDAAFVPILSLLLFREAPSVRTILGGLLAITGLALLSLNSGIELRPGSAWGILSAVAFAFWVMSLARASEKHSPVVLSLAQMIAAFIVCLVCALGAGQLRFPGTFFAWLSCIYLGTIATGLRFVIQSSLQRFLTATEASMIYLVEPVSVALIGMLFLGEHLSQRQGAGCCAIMLGIVLSQMRRKVIVPVVAQG